MKILNIICLLLLSSVYLIGQDYKPYKKEVDNSQGEYKGYTRQNDSNSDSQGNSADGFFDNYLNAYDGDPNVALMKQNEQIYEEKKKLLREKEAILISLDSIEYANKKEEEKLFDLKSKAETEKVKKGNYQGYQNNSSNRNNNQQSQNNSSNSYSRTKDDNANIIYEYERKVVRRPSN